MSKTKGLDDRRGFLLLATAVHHQSTADDARKRAAELTELAKVNDQLAAEAIKQAESLFLRRT